jgi:hypothetical protein
LHALEITSLARDLHNALDCASNHNNLAVGGPGRFRYGPETGNVRGKCRHRNAPPRILHELGDRFCDVGFRGRSALSHRVRRISHDHEAALLAQCTQFFLVGRIAEKRRWIDFPVAGMQHGAGGCSDNQRIRLRN